ncbi:MAG: sulfotransferase, partial [Myxococcota bacterium]
MAGAVDPTTALGLVTAHLGRHPDDHAAWAVAAEALVRLDRPDEAVAAARRAQRPELPDRLALLAWVLAAAGEAREARMWLAELGADVAVSVAWERVARAHDHLGEASAAVAAHGRARALAPDDMGLALRFAERLERAGRVTHAGQVVDEVLEARPGWPPARRVRVRLLARLDDLDGAAAEARVLLDGGELLDDVASGLMLELSRIEARRGDTRASVHWAERGNRRALQEFRSRGGDPDALWQELDTLARARLPPPSPPSGPDRAAPPRHRAAFVVGFPRSGTTLVQQMIAAHPAVLTFDEAPLVGGARDGGITEIEGLRGGRRAPPP